jgi:hypothetical protein
MASQQTIYLSSVAPLTIGIFAWRQHAERLAALNELAAYDQEIEI